MAPALRLNKDGTKVLQFHRECILANAKALYGPQHTYDVIGTFATSAILIAYITDTDGSVDCVVKLSRTSDKIYSSSIPYRTAIVGLHEDIAQLVAERLQSLQYDQVFLKTEALKEGNEGKSGTNELTF
ncbi:hypothetical protein DPSP01_005173 [Paraphaeosphaeria sporulosa]